MRFGWVALVFVGATACSSLLDLDRFSTREGVGGGAPGGGGVGAGGQGGQGGMGGGPIECGDGPTWAMPLGEGDVQMQVLAIEVADDCGVLVVVSAQDDLGTIDDAFASTTGFNPNRTALRVLRFRPDGSKAWQRLLYPDSGPNLAVGAQDLDLITRDGKRTWLLHGFSYGALRSDDGQAVDNTAGRFGLSAYFVDEEMGQVVLLNDRATGSSDEFFLSRTPLNDYELLTGGFAGPSEDTDPDALSFPDATGPSIRGSGAARQGFVALLEPDPNNPGQDLVRPRAIGDHTAPRHSARLGNQLVVAGDFVVDLTIASRTMMNPDGDPMSPSADRDAFVAILDPATLEGSVIAFTGSGRTVTRGLAATESDGIELLLGYTGSVVLGGTTVAASRQGQLTLVTLNADLQLVRATTFDASASDFDIDFQSESAGGQRLVHTDGWTLVGGAFENASLQFPSVNGLESIPNQGGRDGMVIGTAQGKHFQHVVQSTGDEQVDRIAARGRVLYVASSYDGTYASPLPPVTPFGAGGSAGGSARYIMLERVILDPP